MEPPNFLGTTMIDIDIDTNNPASNDLPTWLRDMLDRALNATGIRTKKKVASEEAIASLEDVDIKDLESKDCPICYDEYEIKSPDEAASTEKDENVARSKNGTSYKRKLPMDHSQDELYHELRHKFNLPIQSDNEATLFKDPSFFFPIDQGGINYCRFPQRNIHSLEPPTREDLLPGYNEVMKERNKKESEEEMIKNAGHIPVRMPNCNHIFGKSCIIEWLKNNVSCPLCRKEVEELKEKDPKQIKMERLKQSTMNNFNDPDASLDHLMNHSTDVFNPFRRPFNPSITPLTDSSMNQNFASPTYSLFGNSWEPVGVRDPNLVLPGKFPMPDFHNLIPLSGTRSFTIRGERPRHFNNRRQEDRNNDNSNNDSNNNNQGFNRRDSNVSSSSEMMSSDGMSSPSEPDHFFTVNRAAEDSLNDGSNSDISNNPDASRSNNARSNRHTWVWSTLFGRGGPERSRRNPNNGSRQHPYSRPSPE